MNTELTKKMFEDIIVIFVNEPGAMGPNTMEFMNSIGETINVAYTVDNTYETLRDVFPLLKECYWNGPMHNERDTIGGIKVGGGDFATKIPKGWKHCYLDVGNHICIREAYFDKAMSILSKHENIDITFEWERILLEGGFLENNH